MIQLTNEQHCAILLLEALGLVHDIGKLSDKFLISRSGDFHYDLFVDPSKVGLFNGSGDPSAQSNARKKVAEWLVSAETPDNCAFSERSDFTDILNGISITDWNGTSYTLAELAPFVMKPGYGAKTYHWVETLGRTMAPGLLIGTMHGASHFDKPDKGKQQPNDDLNRGTPFGYEIKIEKNNFLNILSSLPLNEIATVAQKSNDRRQWFNLMKDGLKMAIADTRRPLNDVTLWDWGYLVASMTKAAAHYLFATENKDTSFKEIPLRVLRINIDKLSLYTCSDKISDLLGIKSELETAFSKVQEAIEFDWVLGNMLYHDETGAYYLIPSFDNLTGETIKELRKAIQHFFPDDLVPRVQLGDPVKVKDLDLKEGNNIQEKKDAIKKLVANNRQEAREEPQFMAGNNLYLFEEEWGSKRPGNAEICTVCGKYPVGYPESASAGDNGFDRLEEWATYEKAKERHICRYCLTRRGRRAETWEKKLQEATIWTDEVADDNGRIALFTGMFALDEWLDGTALETIKLSDKSGKYPSPALLFRIVETSRDFWERISSKVLGDASKNTELRLRLRLFPESPDSLNLGKFHTYELVLGNNRIGVVWDGRSSFLTTENLETVARRLNIKPADIAGKLYSACSLRIPSSFGNPGKTEANLIIRSVEETVPYIPAIPLVAEPSLCMALLPANCALDFVQQVIDTYQNEMNRVQDLLPLGIGLVFCSSRTPIRSVMEAGMAMREMLKSNQDEVWKIVEASEQNGSADLKFKNGIRMSFRKTFGDSSHSEEDRWFRHYERHRSDVPIKISEISKCQSLKVKPGRFDFEFLDTSGRRFDIVYSIDGKRPDPSKPWNVADFTRLIDLWQNHFRFLSPTQRNLVIGLIETKRKEWSIVDNEDEVFNRFVEHTLAGANWPRNHLWKKLEVSIREQLVIAGVNGTLPDLDELFTSILKDKSQKTEP